MTIPQIVVQASHAAIQANLPNNENHPHLVVIGIKSEEKLKNALNYVKSLGFSVFPFIEPDIGDQMTAFATQIISQENKKFFKKFQCLKM